MNPSPNLEAASSPLSPGVARSLCELCGSPVRAGSTCRTCAVALVDFSLFGLEEEPALPAGTDRTEESSVDYGHYQVCRAADGLPWELGRGSMGITYKAIDNNLGCAVALKVINTEHFPGPRARERLLREARAAASLRHPNIAGIYHLGQDADRCFYAMEFIEGETLEAYLLRQGALPPAAALNIVLQAARALHAAHTRGFIHRDIKPTNLMLPEGDLAEGGSPTVKLIDFGLVKAAEQAEDPVSRAYFAGTPYYASPEQLLRGFADARSDIYSLGRCLFHMLTGRAPMGPHPSRTSRINVPAEGQGGSLPVFPASVVALVESMTATNPALRPQTAAALIERVQSCLRRLEADGRASALSWEWRGRRIARGWLVLPVMALVGLAAWFGVPRIGTTPNSPSSATISPEARMLYAEAEEAYAKNNKEANARAIDLYTRAIQEMPVFADAHAGLALSYYRTVFRLDRQKDNMVLAERYAERAVALAPDSPKGYHALGVVLSGQNHPWQALEQFHKALEQDPGYLPAMHDFGLMWVWVGKPERAIPWAEECARRQPSKAGVWMVAAEANTEIGADEAAGADYRRYLEINPTNGDGYCGLAHLSTLHQDYDKAREYCALALSVNKTSIFALCLRAQVAFFSGDHATAEAEYRELLKMDRTGLATFHGGISFLSALGLLRCQAGDRVEGEALLEEAAKMRAQDSEGPQNIYDLSGIRAAQGRKEDALALLRQAVACGWTDCRSTSLDPRFTSLREEEAFQKILEGLDLRLLEAQQEADRLRARPLRIADYPVQPGRK